MGISALIALGTTLADKFIPDPEQKAKAQLEVARLAQSGELEELAARAGVIQAEAKSQHWITATWRPILMLTFGAIVANNYILAPWLHAFGFTPAPLLELPPDMWELLKLGVGGYVVGRSAEKIAEKVKR